MNNFISGDRDQSHRKNIDTQIQTSLQNYRSKTVSIPVCPIFKAFVNSLFRRLQFEKLLIGNETFFAMSEMWVFHFKSFEIRKPSIFALKTNLEPQVFFRPYLLSGFQHVKSSFDKQFSSKRNIPIIMVILRGRISNMIVKFYRICPKCPPFRSQQKQRV